MDLKNFYNHISIWFGVVTRLQEDLFPSYQSIKRKYEFSEYFILDSDHPYYYWNVQIYTSLGHSLLEAINNYNCLKSSMSPQAYKVVSTYAHKFQYGNSIQNSPFTCPSSWWDEW